MKIFSQISAFLFLLAPAFAQEAAGAPVRNVEDLLRGMPIGPGLYSAAKPNPQTCIKATESLSKIAVGRPIELQFAFDPRFSEYDRLSGLLIARTLPLKHRHRLDEILVRFQFTVTKETEVLRPKLRAGFSTGVKGTIEKVEFGPEGNKVLLLVTLKEVKTP